MTRATEPKRPAHLQSRIRVQDTPTIVAMEPEHWITVRAIYLEGIATGNSTFDRKVPDWTRWDADHLERCRCVALNDNLVIGWAALIPVSPRPVYAGVAEVDIVVATNARAQGVGKALLRDIIDRSEAAGIWTLQATLFPENEAALKLLDRSGFREVGRRERIGKHFSRWRDIVLLERRSSRVGGDRRKDHGDL